MTETSGGTVSSKQTVPGGIDSWRAYWTTHGMPWRTEPEVGEERQRFLAERRAVQPNIEKGIYPFRNEHGSIRLDRADVEWLLATQQSAAADSGLPPALGQHGLDLRGAALQEVNLSGLSLAYMDGALQKEEWRAATPEQRALAAVQLERANLVAADISHASLALANMSGTNLMGAKLIGSSLEHAVLTGARLDGANLTSALVGGTDLRRAAFDRTTVLDNVDLATRFGSLREWAANGCLGLVLYPIVVIVFYSLRHFGVGAGLRWGPLVADVAWADANLSVIDLTDLRELGDERLARQRTTPDGKNKPWNLRLAEYRAAVRAYRQLGIALRNQGQNEVADRLNYRAQVLQRHVLRRDWRWIRASGSWLLDLIAGYGYRPLRSLATYVVTILVFAFLYWCVTNNISLTHGLFTQVITTLGMQPPTPSSEHLQGYQALVVSVTSFHGRGFFQPMQSPGDKVSILAAIEAAIGLLLEITFIATFTQRFFAR